MLRLPLPHLLCSQTEGAVPLALFGQRFVLWPLHFRVPCRQRALALEKVAKKAKGRMQVDSNLHQKPQTGLLPPNLGLEAGLEHSKVATAQKANDHIIYKFKKSSGRTRGGTKEILCPGPPHHKDEAICFALAVLARRLLAIPGCD